MLIVAFFHGLNAFEIDVRLFFIIYNIQLVKF